MEGILQAGDSPSGKMDPEELQLKRRQTIKKTCNDLKLESESAAEWSSQLWEMKHLKIMFCPVPGTFISWKKTMEIWTRSQEDARSSISLTDSKYERGKRQIPVVSRDANTAQEFNSVFNTSLKVLFTREPYMQLFAYYVDNIFVPSNASLDLTQLILKSRKYGPDKFCGKKLAFSNFCLYIMDSRFRLNVMGNLRSCDVCGMVYDVIGKKDTLEDDIMYVYNKMKADHRFSATEDFAEEYDFSRIETYVKAAFERKDGISRSCLSTHAMYLRLWRQLQIWGFIDKNITFPYNEEESDALAYDQLLSAALRSYHKSVPMSCVNQNEAFAQAYFALESKELERLRKCFEADFFLFGYQDRPSSLFFKQGPQSDFQYFDVLSN